MSAIRDLKPRRIALLLPCCIGDVLMATPLLAALRNAWTDANVSWVAGGAARALISDHDQVDATLECDPLPQRSLASLWQLSGLLRDGRFDLVSASGVLHHLRDPLAGWEAASSRLAQGGLMRVGLYSATARRSITRAREIIRRREVPPTPEGMRAFHEKRAPVFKGLLKGEGPPRS